MVLSAIALRHDAIPRITISKHDTMNKSTNERLDQTMKRNHPWTRHVVLLLFIVALILLSGCRSAPIYNAKDVPISPRLSASEEQIAEAIWSAGRQLGWSIKQVGAWKIKAVKHIRRHSLTVSIEYSKTAFNILYVDSENLKYDGRNIHENYNVWVRQLEERIQKEIGFRLPEPRESN